jgi:biotin transport system substrate-specific component
MIPLQPVPVTLQTFAVLFIGMIYGARLGTATVVSFIALGLCGLPILANTTTGMSLGYLIGFIPAVYVAGILIQYGWGKSMLTTALAALIGTSIVLACGLAWLAIFIGFSAAINVGLMPFVGVELVKIALLAFTVPQFWKTVAV